jgi:Methylase involved in ubiquinone/menaquinone biosynthesis
METISTSSVKIELVSDQLDDLQWYDPRTRTETSFFDDCIESHSFSQRRSFLNVGCGTGYFIARYGALFRTRDGLDTSDALLSVASSRLLEARLMVGTATALPYHSEVFDLLICRGMDIGLPGALQELARVLAPGGLLLMANENLSSRHDVLVELTALGLELGDSFLVSTDGSCVPPSTDYQGAPRDVAAWVLMASRPASLI